MTRRRRSLTPPEIELWHLVTRHVEPLAGRNKPAAEKPAVDTPPHSPAASTLSALKSSTAKPLPAKPSVPPLPAPPAVGVPAKAAKATVRPVPPPARPVPAFVPSPPPHAPLERKLKRGLARGTHPIHAVLDLHGLRQEEALMRLRGFLAHAQRDGATVVLVVTGKGARAAETVGSGEERGVLRRMVPHWLRLPDVKSMVVGFEEAAQHQGGAGALYVRLRRRRGPEDRA